MWLDANEFAHLLSSTSPIDAKKSANALKNGSGRKGARIHYKTHFYRPKTQTQPRNPRIKAIKQAGTEDKYRHIRYPVKSEGAMRKMEEFNTLVFIVDILSNKKQIKAALKGLYDIKAEKVNTLIRPDGLKKAYVKLAGDHDALDVAQRIGIL